MLIQQLELIILFHFLQISIMLYIILYVINIMSNMRNDNDKYCIKQEDDEIIAHTHNISIKHLKNVNLIVLMIYFLIILLMELNCYFLIFLCYLE